MRAARGELGTQKAYLGVRKKRRIAHAASEVRSSEQLGVRLEHHEQLLALVVAACSNPRSRDHELRLPIMWTGMNVSGVTQLAQEVHHVAVWTGKSTPHRSMYLGRADARARFSLS